MVLTHYLCTNKTKQQQKEKTHLVCFLVCLKSMTVSQPFEMREAVLTSYLSRLVIGTSRTVGASLSRTT
jgi:hypothetical protein